MFLIACRSGNMSIMELLIQNGAEVMCMDSCRRHALHYCVVFGQKDAVKYMIDKGAEIDAKDKNGYTALDLAERLSSDSQVIKWLNPEMSQIANNIEYNILNLN